MLEPRELDQPHLLRRLAQLRELVVPRARLLDVAPHLEAEGEGRRTVVCSNAQKRGEEWRQLPNTVLPHAQNRRRRTLNRTMRSSISSGVSVGGGQQAAHARRHHGWSAARRRRAKRPKPHALSKSRRIRVVTTTRSARSPSSAAAASDSGSRPSARRIAASRSWRHARSRCRGGCDDSFVAKTRGTSAVFEARRVGGSGFVSNPSATHVITQN